MVAVLGWLASFVRELAFVVIAEQRRRQVIEWHDVLLQHGDDALGVARDGHAQQAVPAAVAAKRIGRYVERAGANRTGVHELALWIS